VRYDAAAFRKLAGSRTSEEHRFGAALLSAVDEAERLREQLGRAGMCEDCLGGKHECREPLGGRGWREGECECPQCPGGVSY
jgi:hypothetical protein